MTKRKIIIANKKTEKDKVCIPNMKYEERQQEMKLKHCERAETK